MSCHLCCLVGGLVLSAASLCVDLSEGCGGGNESEERVCGGGAKCVFRF